MKLRDGDSFRAPQSPGSPFPAAMQGREIAASWVVEVLPDFNGSSLDDILRASGERKQSGKINEDGHGGASVPFPYLEMLVCPSDPPATLDRAPLSYVVNTGMRDGSEPGARDFRENGVFHDHYTDSPFRVKNPKLDGPLTTVTSKFISIHGDGLQHTLMLAENVDASSYLDTDERFLGLTWAKPTNAVRFAASGPTVDPPANVRKLNEDIGKQFGLIEEPTFDPNVRITLAGDHLGLEDSAEKVFFYTRPSSFHPRGANVVFCDGHGQFLSEKIDYYVYIMLMTPKGDEVRDPHNHGELITEPGFANPDKPPPPFDEMWVRQ